MTDLAFDLARFTPQQRLELIERLWDSLGDKEIPLSPAQAAELDRRLTTFDEDRGRGVGWEELRAELRRPR